MLSIADEKVGSFSDISLEHKIFKHSRICVLTEITGLGLKISKQNFKELMPSIFPSSRQK